MNKAIISGLLFSVFMLTACEKNTGKDDKEDNGKDREQLLLHYADSIVIPSYLRFNTTFNQFESTLNQFINNPDESLLAQLRTDYSNAYISWQTVELFDFGPGELYTLRNFCNIYPADTTGIVSNFANPTVSLEVPASYPQQGFPAFDYLINGVASTDAGVVAYYKHPAESSKRKAYLSRILTRMNDLIDQVIGEWQGSYRAEFISKTGLDLNASTSRMVNGLVLHYERFIRSGKIGIPSGVMLNGVLAPEKAEALYNNNISLALLNSAHKAYTDCFNGKTAYGNQGASLKSYLDALDARDQSSGKLLSTLINEQLALVETEINKLLPSIKQQILTDNTAMKAVYDQMQAAVRMLKVDMTSAMSITITYTDNDGD